MYQTQVGLPQQCKNVRISVSVILHIDIETSNNRAISTDW